MSENLPGAGDLTKLLPAIHQQETWRRIAASVVLIGAAVLTVIVGPTVAIVVTFLVLAALWMFPSIRRQILGQTLVLRDGKGRPRIIAVAEDRNGESFIAVVRTNGEPAVMLRGSDEGPTALTLAAEPAEASVGLVRRNGDSALLLNASNGGSTTVSLAGSTSDDGVMLTASADAREVVVGPAGPQTVRLWHRDGRAAMEVDGGAGCQTLVTPVGISASSDGAEVEIGALGLRYTKGSGTFEWP